MKSKTDLLMIFPYNYCGRGGNRKIFTRYFLARVVYSAICMG